MHLLFTDDTLAFCKDTRDQLVYLSWAFLWFEALFELRINLEKSTILPVGRVEDPSSLAMELGCELASLPASY